MVGAIVLFSTTHSLVFLFAFGALSALVGGGVIRERDRLAALIPWTRGDPLIPMFWVLLGGFMLVGGALVLLAGLNALAE